MELFMSIERMMTRVFFASAMVVTLASGMAVSRADAAEPVDEEAKCLDGNRKMCATKPIQDGGTLYFYWV
jgi:uncharacterized membrane protein